MATPKQRKALEKIVENSRLDKPKPVGKILKEVGYSDGTAIKPSQVLESKGFKELVEQTVPDNDVVEIIKEGLHAKKVITSHTEPDYEYPDHANRHKFLETTLKLKGHAKENSTPNIVVVPIYAGRSVND